MLDEVKPDFAYILCENYMKPTVAEEVAKRGINLETPYCDAEDNTAACTLSGENVEIDAPLFETLTPAFNLEVMKMLDAAVRSDKERREISL